MQKTIYDLRFWLFFNFGYFFADRILHFNLDILEFKIIAKTFQGLEEVLAKEVTALGANNIEIGNRMVSFTGDQEMLYRANFCLRTAVRVLKPIKEFTATDADEVYGVVKSMDWDSIMDVKNTFLIDSVVFSDKFRHSKFVAYRVKDAIADYFREKYDERPNVSISNPDFRINIHISETQVCISLDSSGESLHKRGYRTGTVPAPLNEVLAAGMILMTGWDGDSDLIDPFCGSGTILVEAALIAQNIYPGIFREEFGFERWKDFDEELLERIYNDDSQERDFDHKIYGYDINRNAVAIAQDNVRSAGVSKIVEVEQGDIYDFEQPDRPALMITNPPYGERLTPEGLLDLYKTLGSRLKQNFAGNDAWIISSHEECFSAIGFRPSTKIALYNGSIPCEFRKYQVFDGSLRERREEGMDLKSEEELRRNAKFKPHKMKDDDDDGESRRGGSRDDEHYFRSRPDRDRKRDDKPFRRGKKEEFKPLFEGDFDHHVSRHSFKWGDRHADYEAEDWNRYDHEEHVAKRREDGKRGGGRPGGKRDGEKRRDGKPRDNRRDDRRDKKGKDRKDAPKWGFDKDGKPFKKDED